MNRHRSFARVHLCGLALLLALGALAPPAALADPIAVPCSVDALVSALAAVGTGAATLDLAPGCTYTLTTVDNTTANGYNGLPLIQGDVTIHGHGAIIERQAVRLGSGSSGSGAAVIPAGFRLLEVAAGATLTLEDVTLRGGFAAGPGGTQSKAPQAGGAVYNAGTLRANRATVVENHALEGGGVFNAGSLTIDDSTVANNVAVPASGDPAYEPLVITNVKPSRAGTSSEPWIITLVQLCSGQTSGTLQVSLSMSVPRDVSPFYRVQVQDSVSLIDIVAPDGRHFVNTDIWFDGTLEQINQSLSNFFLTRITPQPSVFAATVWDASGTQVARRFWQVATTTIVAPC
jgi:hypothetical protein